MAAQNGGGVEVRRVRVGDSPQLELAEYDAIISKYDVKNVQEPVIALSVAEVITNGPIVDQEYC